MVLIESNRILIPVKFEFQYMSSYTSLKYLPGLYVIGYRNKLIPFLYDGNIIRLKEWLKIDK